MGIVQQGSEEELNVSKMGGNSQLKKIVPKTPNPHHLHKPYIILTIRPLPHPLNLHNPIQPITITSQYCFNEYSFQKDQGVIDYNPSTPIPSHNHTITKAQTPIQTQNPQKIHRNQAQISSAQSNFTTHPTTYRAPQSAPIPTTTPTSSQLHYPTLLHPNPRPTPIQTPTICQVPAQISFW